MVVVLSDAEDACAVDGQLWRASEQWLCSAGRERDGVMGGLGGKISWSRQKIFRAWKWERVKTVVMTLHASIESATQRIFVTTAARPHGSLQLQIFCLLVCVLTSKRSKERYCILKIIPTTAKPWKDKCFL
jgi:hypothetical protein